MAKQIHHDQTQKKVYRLRNWSQYNESLKQRGALDVWIDKRALKSWQVKLPPARRRRGAQPIYSDLAISSTLMFGIVFGQRLRQTEGLARSVFKLMKINLPVPDYATLSRRGRRVKIKIPKRKYAKHEKLVLVLDSSGLKVFGEGEWKVRQHGYARRRTWRKIHLAVTPQGELRAVELTPNSVHDSQTAPSLIDKELAALKSVIGDSGYDARGVYRACMKRGVNQVIILPRRNARIWQHGNRAGTDHPRDINLRCIRRTSRKRWKERVGYHVRSLAETAVFRFKTIFGERLHARHLAQQGAEASIKVAALNRMFQLGMPDSYPELVTA